MITTQFTKHKLSLHTEPCDRVDERNFGNRADGAQLGLFIEGKSGHAMMELMPTNRLNGKPLFVNERLLLWGQLAGVLLFLRRELCEMLKRPIG